MRFLIVIVLAAVAWVMVPPTVIASPNYVASSSDNKKQRVISKSQAINAAKRQVNGKVLSATLIRSKGPAVYRVKMLVSEKRVRTVFVDGRNGTVIRIN